METYLDALKVIAVFQMIQTMIHACFLSIWFIYYSKK